MTDEHDPFEEQDATGVPEGLPCVELEFATLRGFREEMAPYLNYDGFFARTDRPLPRGTTVEFKFCMPEEFVLAQGTAVVAWTIEPEGNPDLVPGMALRFGQVNKQSRAVIDELVDFHIATGGDPFDVGLRTDRLGEIPTDSLGGTGGGATSTIDSPAPVARDLPLPPDPERSAPADDGVLPDWLSESAGLAGRGKAEAVDALDFDYPSDERSPAPSTTDEFDFSTERPGDGFEVDTGFDDGVEEATPRRPEEGSFRQMALSPRPAEKPPRDLRIGLVVTAAIVVVAVVVLVWSVWLRKEPQDIVQTVPTDATVGDVGVVLIDDDEESQGAPALGGDAIDAGAAPSNPEGLPVEEGVEAQAEGDGQPSPSGAGELTPPRTQTPASRVVDIVAAARDGSTTVVIRGNGVFDTSALKISRLEEPMRLWVRVFGIETFYKPNEVEVGSPEVHRVRIGYHPEDSPPALYVVLDLAGDDVYLLDRNLQGDAIRLTVGRK